MLKIKVNDDILLVKIRMKSAAAIFKSVEKSRKYLEEWMPWVTGTRKIEDVRDFIRMVNRVDCIKKDMVFEIWHKDNFAGIISLKEIDLANQKSEIGYWLTEKYSGRGIMSRSCEAVIKFAFEELKLNKVLVKCGVDNIRSYNIPKQLKFTFEGVERDGEYLHNRFMDLKVYSLLRKEWLKQNMLNKKLK